MPLFEGRDDDIVRCARILGRPESRLMVLHGESGVGKSSFLRAGLIPYLEEDCVGYRFVRDRSDGRDRQHRRYCSSAPPTIPAGQIARAISSSPAKPLSTTGRRPGRRSRWTSPACSPGH